MDANETIEYLTECTLATIDDLAIRKRISKSEARRQCSIAAKGINYLILNNVHTRGRVHTVIYIFGGNVMEYFHTMRKKWNPKN